jgi:hypothetical protein
MKLFFATCHNMIGYHVLKLNIGENFKYGRVVILRRGEGRYGGSVVECYGDMRVLDVEW